MNATWRQVPHPRGKASVMFFIASAVAGAGFAAGLAWGHPILAARWALLWRLAAWAAVWVAGVVATWHLRPRALVPVVLAATVLVRVAALAGPPITSDDLYRYAWDGRVQASGLDAYRYAPTAPQLVGLREPWLWPDGAGCAALHRPIGCTRINRPDQRTIYPPVAEAWFAVVYRVSGIGERHKAWQVAALAVDIATVLLLLVALRRWGRDPRWVAIYALCPAPALELVNNGHVDGLAIALLVAALVVARPPPDHRAIIRSPVARDVVTGVLIGAAALVKVYPALLLVALLGVAATRVARRAAWAAAAAVSIVALAYLPHVAAVGSKVLGYLPKYLKEEHYTKGGRFLLAGVVGLHGSAATTFAIAVAVGAIGWVAWRRPDAPTGGVVLFGTLVLVTSPVQPWYAVSVVAFAALAARPWWAAVSAAGYPYFFAVILSSRHAVGIGRAAYGAAAVTVITAELAAARRERRAPTRREAQASAQEPVGGSTTS